MNGGRQMLGRNAVEGFHLRVVVLQLLQGDLAVVIGVDPPENRLAHFLVQQVWRGEKLFLAQHAITIAVKILHHLLR
jgi:hypothetical protein